MNLNNYLIRGVSATFEGPGHHTFFVVISREEFLNKYDADITRLKTSLLRGIIASGGSLPQSGKSSIALFDEVETDPPTIKRWKADQEMVYNTIKNAIIERCGPEIEFEITPFDVILDSQPEQ